MNLSLAPRPLTQTLPLIPHPNWANVKRREGTELFNCAQKKEKRRIRRRRKIITNSSTFSYNILCSKCCIFDIRKPCRGVSFSLGGKLKRSKQGWKLNIDANQVP
eukprot:4506575-Amphidinium_carterae.1